MEETAKILLLGKTGVGKSSFINYFLDKDVAQVGVGKPVTEGIMSYRLDGGKYPVEIFDSKGVEALEAGSQMDEMMNEIIEKNGSDQVFDWYHTIFYCVSMANPRFEDFEAQFLNRLQRSLSQHIHIILTHSDMASPEAIAAMRERISSALDNTDNIKIFEVVSVDMRKRNGQVVSRKGREEVMRGVFDLLLDDIATRLSGTYADSLWNALSQAGDTIFAKAEEVIDEFLKAKTVMEALKDSSAVRDRVIARIAEVVEEMKAMFVRVQKEQDEKFDKILNPIAQLYASYLGLATDSYVQDLGLTFDKSYEWMDTRWIEGLNEQALIAEAAPNLSADSGSKSMFGKVGAGLSDVLGLRKNINKMLDKYHQKFEQETLPSKEKIQKQAYDRIVEYMKPLEEQLSVEQE